MHHVFFVAICLIWGSNFIMMSRASLAIGPVEIGFYRLCGGGLILLTCWWLSDHRAIPFRSWPHIAFVGFFGNAIPFVLQPLLISRGFDHSYMGMLVSFVPLLTIFFSVLMLGVWPRWNEVVGVTGGLLAMIALLWEGQLRGISFSFLLLAFSVPLAYACCNTYIRWKLSHVPPLPLTSGVQLSGAVFLLPLVLMPGWIEALGIGGPAHPQRWPTAMAALAWMAVVGTGLAMVMFMSNIQARGPLFAGMVSYPVPLVALAWGFYDQERISLLQLLAMGVILAMVALVQKDVRRERRVTQGTAEPAGSDASRMGASQHRQRTFSSRIRGEVATERK